MNERPIWIVVEDFDQLRQDLQDIFELFNENIVVHTFPDGAAALEYFRQVETEDHQPPEMILSDIMMPRMDGYELLRNVQLLPKCSQSAFVFLTAKSEKYDIQMANEMGINAYLTKPFMAEELLTTLSAIVAEHKWRNKNSQG